MRSNFNYSVITGNMGKLGDRFCPTGYSEDVSFEQKLKYASQVEGLSAVELCYNIDGDESNVKSVKELLDKYNLVASIVNVPLNGEIKWRFGTLSSSDENVRKSAIQVTKDTINFAKGVGCKMINLWLGQDGFDYSFQVDYLKLWDNLVEAIKELADYDKEMKIAVEFKAREPRNRCIINSNSTTLLLVDEIGRENVGITIDVGHVLQNKNNIAQAVYMTDKCGKLFNMHMNDNYADWDDDLIVGSVHTIEYLELFYALRKIAFDGYCSVDIFPYREDGYEAVRESVEAMQMFDGLIDKIGYETITKTIKKSNVPDTLNMIRKHIYKQ